MLMELPVVTKNSPSSRPLKGRMSASICRGVGHRGACDRLLPDSYCNTGRVLAILLQKI